MRIAQIVVQISAFLKKYCVIYLKKFVPLPCKNSKFQELIINIFKIFKLCLI